MKTDHIAKATHDLSLPDWGPYSKKYFGISHIADAERGYRFDFTLIPGLYRRDLCIPDALKEAGYTPWEAAPGLEYYSYRQQVEWQDRIYCDISFSRIDDQTRLVRCEGINNTDLSSALALHLIGGLEFPKSTTVDPVMPSTAVWINAADHAGLDFAVPRPQDGLTYDGMRRGEERHDGTVSGFCIGQRFGKDAGDSVRFQVTPEDETEIVIRYMLPSQTRLSLKLTDAADDQVTLVGTGDFSTAVIYRGRLKSGMLSLISEGGAEIKIDGIVIGATGIGDELSFVPSCRDNKPEIEAGPHPKSALLRFPAVNQVYGWRWSEDGAQQRCFQVHNIKETLIYDDAIHHHYCTNFDRGGNDRCAEVMIQPVTIPAHGRKIVYMLLCNGTADEVRQRLAAMPEDQTELENIYLTAKKTAWTLDSSPDGDAFRFSQERMAAVTLTNLVYPVYIKRSYIRHSPPGRCWDSLYSWDSGFIGLGLLELDTERAIENLNAYVTEPGDVETAFIHHGTPLPVQHYLYQELWNRTRDREMLAFFYPRLKQYYEFLAGHAASSVTRKTTTSGLLKTWDYFYNSGGWDDYPPQWHVHMHHLHHIAPAVSTSHAIRAAKILSLAAAELGKTDDVAFYRRDIDAFAAALQTHAWDSECGYFSYVEHDADGNPRGFFRHQSGANFNMGLDGVSPLVAGVCTDEQRKIFWERLESPQHFWTEMGLSTVDQAAPYYRRDGYWNGSVWMPHQWFYWKAALNDGNADFAWQIASTALAIWERETAATYYCFEHFAIESGRGGGWHHFSGLSTPVLCWHGAYHQPGRLTFGYDVWPGEITTNQRVISAELRIAGNTGEITTLVAVTGEGEFSAEYAGQGYPLRRRTASTVEIDLPKNSSGKLNISRNQ